MTQLKYLDKYIDEVDRCVKCGGCQAACPTFDATGDESMVARGRMALVEAVIKGRIGLTEGFARRINSCLDCKACMATCPSGVKVDRIIYAAKAEISAQNGCNPFKKMAVRLFLTKGNNHPNILAAAGFLKRFFYDSAPAALPFPSSIKWDGVKRLLPAIGKRPFRKSSRSSTITDPKGRVAFFVGCATNLFHQHIGKAVLEVLEHNKIEVVMAEDEQCCAIPFLSMGDRDTAVKLAKRNIDIFTSLQVDAIITCCATCGATLRDYHLWVDDDRAESLSRKSMDIHEYLAKNTDYTHGIGELNKTVTWHDPCHLSRGQGIKDEPREILKSIPGLEFKEMKKPCYCCGFGGEVSITDYDMSMKIAARKVDSINKSCADEVATGCPACKMHIEDALNHYGGSRPVRHTVEYLAEAYRQNKS